MVGPGVCKALVVRFDCDQKPSLVLCRSDNRYCVITPAAAKQTLQIHEDWSAHPMLSTGPVAKTPWMRMD